MLKLYDGGIYLVNGKDIVPEGEAAKIESLTGKKVTKEEAMKGTMAYGILKSHNTSSDMEELKLKFDSMTSHDITYVGIIQTARASGMKEFPLPYVLTNCHNSLCAVGGTINEDDHKFALSAAHKYGGIYVPTNMANIHSYNREMMAGCGRMILGSDSHTRYGALGTMAIGEGGGELAKHRFMCQIQIIFPLSRLPEVGKSIINILSRHNFIPGWLVKRDHVKNCLMYRFKADLEYVEIMGK